MHPDHSAGSVLGDGVTEPIPVFKGEGCSGRMCMTMRVVRKPGSRTVTSAVRGQLRNAATRAEALSLIMAGK